MYITDIQCIMRKDTGPYLRAAPPGREEGTFIENLKLKLQYRMHLDEPIYQNVSAKNAMLCCNLFDFHYGTSRDAIDFACFPYRKTLFN
ncbi:MAG: hypothetical protein BWX96_01439 [Bacteroidetes bacterium ADurb.Bin145]|nr:MAG: hypothetical protein BWX96_01439 [Bacteroidetes bacterium ADurb.Bin145]